MENTLNELVQGRLKEGKGTHGFLLNAQKAYDTVWRYGLQLNFWEFGARGEMWRVSSKGLVCSNLTY